ncbi:MAG: Fe-S-containing hydro-lyase [Nitrospinota bacterium]|jgi:fumarate hydratase subunit beta|nr:fumarate hydratase [Nitrospinota bacterium]MDP7350515.1 Fe-S-containing hydro-lyase [Nitrospinota bacterium]MDP7580122.1 Fe-S-containing hydro-lyase [Nitrospinota bacterium]HJN01888.1 Fe-S-containing hydro-lyase [Nitrospinota bacterium]
MSEVIKITTPLSDEVVDSLKSGDQVSIKGILYTARDAAHKRLIDLLDHRDELPFDIKGQIIYYVGPTPAKPGAIIGSAGPTTSYRMDPYAPRLMEVGMKGMIGKGNRTQSVIDAMVKYKSIYFAAIGGAGALVARSIKKVEIIAYEDLGPEAIRKMEVEDFQAVVVNDTYGNDVYKEGMNKYKR